MESPRGGRRRRWQDRTACDQLLERGVALFINLGRGQFEDRARTWGCATTRTLGRLGLALADFDHDGWPDRFVANGHVDNNLERLGCDSPYPRARLVASQPQGITISARDTQRRGVLRFRPCWAGMAYGDSTTMATSI